ncbi:uL30 family ribosomal protein [Candidatus Pacearchaeota archaeon]|nr:uL30 family ribosomal protein [Candidatus Pacearchaeota archaeon]
MICIIRIRGQIGIRYDIDETLFRMGIRKKYSCIVIKETKENLGMLAKIENFVAYGKIDKEILAELIKKRGKAIGNKKIDAEKIASEFAEGKIDKRFSELGIKDFFTLHPARGGMETKFHYPKGVLGNNKEDIAKLLRRML